MHQSRSARGGALHWWLKIQLLSHLYQLPSKADQCSTALTPGHVKLT
jgi:hypothetical protein